MNALGSAVRELVGLFVDDGSLVLAILAVVALSAILVALIPGTPLVAGAVLLAGCVLVLVVNAVRAARQ